MKETFDFSRFWKYFLYDNRQMWRHNSRNLLIISGLGLLTYVVWILCGVIFKQTWMGPSMAVRLTVFVCSWLGLIFFQTKSYGYLTDKAAGSAWLMLPASRTEKFVSMLLITLVEMPVFLVLVFGGIDALVTALDPTVQGWVFGNLSQISAAMQSVSEGGLDLGMGTAGLGFNIYVQFCANMLFCLLCGICFKRNKLFHALAIMMGAGFLSSLAFTGIFASMDMDGAISVYADKLAGGDKASLENAMNIFLNAGLVLNWVLAIGMGAGIYHRIKTLKH